MSAVLTPYLAFESQTAEAMKFYQSVLGGKLMMQTFAEAGMTQNEADKDKIIHASLENGTLSFMASDGGSMHPIQMGDNISMSISGTDEANLRKYFEGLSAGGKVDMPLEKQFWGDVYGQLTDKFGIHWMINIHSENPKK